eukprot:scaffold30011_cov112-Isochrysis_galbana.AAC.1
MCEYESTESSFMPRQLCMGHGSPRGRRAAALCAVCIAPSISTIDGEPARPLPTTGCVPAGLIQASSINSIPDACAMDRERGLALRQAGRIVDFAHAVLATPLPEVKPGGGCVRNDVAADGLLVVAERGSAIHLCHHLVRDDARDAKLRG